MEFAIRARFARGAANDVVELASCTLLARVCTICTLLFALAARHARPGIAASATSVLGTGRAVVITTLTASLCGLILVFVGSAELAVTETRRIGIFACITVRTAMCAALRLVRARRTLLT